jgi:hypothetical protein
MPGTWSIWEATSGHHIIPDEDLKPHSTTQCECKPMVEDFENGAVLHTHNAFDGREAYETGERKVS